MNNKLIERAKALSIPNINSSYSKEDCIFLLKDISKCVNEITTEEKEKLIDEGISYSETLTKEGIPNGEYIDMFKESLDKSKFTLAHYIAVMAETILKVRGRYVILVSLARAGSPFGILIKDYIKAKYNINIPHYSISIIRGKGIDENALCYIVNKHKSENIQFVDGWTGKGSITYELKDSIAKFNSEFGTSLISDLAVVADPAGLAPICGTREDIYIPNASLNSTVSGLISRTVFKEGITGEYDFHGAKFYEEYINHDMSNYFLKKVRLAMEGISVDTEEIKENVIQNNANKDISLIESIYFIKDKNKIKPSIGETSRVLLRRKAKFILIKDENIEDVKHLIYLAKEKGVEVIKCPFISYNAIGVIS